MKTRLTSRTIRHQRIRSHLSGTSVIPRLSVFRSLRHIYAQLIDDVSGKTIVSASDWEIKDSKIKPIDKAAQVGQLIAKKAEAKKIKSIVFDRSGYQYHGLIKALADGARQGLNF